MLNAFHSSGSLRLRCALGLAWPLAAYSLFPAIAWFPTDPDSAAGDLSWVNPAIATIVAMVAAAHLLLIAVPLFGQLRRSTRIAAVSPAALVCVSAVITYVRA